MSPQHDKPNTGLRPIARRVPIRSKIDLHFHNFEGLVTGVSANLSTTGMFIQTDSPEAVGSECSFQIRIEDWSPIQGSAEVIWTRTTAEGPERPAGMGVRFVDLDPQSRRMIRWLVDKHLEDGGILFDPTQVPPGASRRVRRPAAAQGAAAPGESSQVRRPAASPPSLRLWPILIGSLAVILLAVVAFAAYLLWLDRDLGWVEPQSPSPEQESAVGQIAAVTPDVVAADPVAVIDDITVSVSNEAVMSFIENWEAAWESRQPERLVALYSDRFQATAYGGRDAWRAEISRQMEAAGFIRVAVSALDITFPEADNARATFYRSLRSDIGDETRRMTLDLEPDAGAWKIRDERFVN